MSENPREPWRVAHPLPGMRLLVVAIGDCDGDAGIAARGRVHLPLSRHFLPDHPGVAGAPLLTLHMNRIDRCLFAGRNPYRAALLGHLKR